MISGAVAISSFIPVQAKHVDHAGQDEAASGQRNTRDNPHALPQSPRNGVIQIRGRPQAINQTMRDNGQADANKTPQDDLNDLSSAHLDLPSLPQVLL